MRDALPLTIAHQVRIPIRHLFRKQHIRVSRSRQVAYTVSAEKEGPLSGKITVRQDRLRLVVPVSRLGMAVDDLPLGIGVGGIGKVDAVGDDGDRVGFFGQDAREDGADDGFHTAVG